MKRNGGDLKVKWNHHGHKYKFILTQQELTQDDTFEILLRKIRRQLPDFNDVLASKDKHGSEDIARLKRLPPRSSSCLRGPPPSYRESQKDTLLQIHNPYHTLPHWGFTPLSHVPSSSFGYSSAHYDAHLSTGTGSGRYGQSLIYGYPPHSPMMHSILCSPFPFSGHHRSWICGPKCLTLSLGGKNDRQKYTSWWNTIF